MGGESKLLHECAIPSVPQAFHPLKDLPRTKDDVIMIDMHQKRFGICLDGSTNLTGEQCCTFFLRMIERIQSPKDAPIPHAILLLFDKSAFVPPEKKRVQEKRGADRSQRGIEPYPPGCTIGDLGLLAPAATAWQLIDTERLAITGYLFREFANLLANELINRHKRQPFLSDIIYDWQRKQVTGAPDDEPRMDPLALWSSRIAEGGSEYVARYGNKVGEVDLLINHYLPFFSDKRILIYSKDLDQLPIAMLWLDNHTTEDWPRALLWIQHETRPTPPSTRNGQPVVKKQKTEEKPLLYCDFIHLYDSILSGDIPNMSPLPPRADRIHAFVLTYILCDCDYFQKKNLCHWFGWAAIMQAVCRAWPTIRGEDRGLKYDAIGDVAVWLFEEQQGNVSSTVTISASGTTSVGTAPLKHDLAFYATELASSKRYKVPTAAMLEEAKAELRFGWPYWAGTQADFSTSADLSSASASATA